MGTFHNDHGPLHGITVVVDTHGKQVFIGRCHEEGPDGMLLMDAGEHQDGEGGTSKDDYIQQAAKVGVWKKHDRVLVPQSDIASVRRLGEI